MRKVGNNTRAGIVTVEDTAMTSNSKTFTLFKLQLLSKKLVAVLLASISSSDFSFLQYRLGYFHDIKRTVNNVQTSDAKQKGPDVLRL